MLPRGHLLSGGVAIDPADKKLASITSVRESSHIHAWEVSSDATTLKITGTGGQEDRRTGPRIESG